MDFEPVAGADRSAIDAGSSVAAASSHLENSRVSSVIGRGDDNSSVRTGTTSALSGERLDLFRKELMPIRQRIEMNADTVASASEIVDGLVSKGQFNKQEVIATLQLMSEKNMGVWFKESEDLLYFV